MWTSTPYRAPRSIWGFDLKGVYPSDSGHDTIGVFVDMTTSYLVLFASVGRSAPRIALETPSKGVAGGAGGTFRM